MTGVAAPPSTDTLAMPSFSASGAYICLDRFTISEAASTIDDSITGAGQNQINYNGSWGHCNPCSGDPANPALYGNSNSWSNVSGNTASIAFTGTKIQLYAVKDRNEGIANVSVDGGAATPVDLYSATRTGNILAWTSPSLTPGSHTLSITVTGTKNASASGAYVCLDRIDVSH